MTVMPDAILLAAGRGTRMGALSDQRPKPLTPVAGRPTLDRIVASLAAEGVSRFTVTAHHLAPLIAGHVELLASAQPELSFSLSMEPELLGIGGGIRHALPHTSSDPVLIANTDAFWASGSDLPISRMLDLLNRHTSGPVLLCVDPPKAIGHRGSHDFTLDAEGRLSRQGDGKPVIYAGVMLVPRAALQELPQGPGSLGPLLEETLTDRRLYGAVLEAPWLHIGDPEAIVEAEHSLLRGRG